MRCFDVELRSVTGERPGFLQALAKAALFCITVGATCSLIQLFVLFNRRRHALHDVLADTVLARTFQSRDTRLVTRSITARRRFPWRFAHSSHEKRKDFASRRVFPRMESGREVCPDAIPLRDDLLPFDRGRVQFGPRYLNCLGTLLDR
jgi:RDD family